VFLVPSYQIYYSAFQQLCSGCRKTSSLEVLVAGRAEVVPLFLSPPSTPARVRARNSAYSEANK